jgi:hypothetical protein
MEGKWQWNIFKKKEKKTKSETPWNFFRFVRSLRSH